IGPQQPGVEFHTMWPPSVTGPSIGTSGPRSPSVKVSTRMVWRASPVRGGGCWMAIGTPPVGRVRGRSTTGDREQQGDLLAVLEPVPALGVGAVDHRQRRAQGWGQLRLVGTEAGEEVVDGCALRQLDRQGRRPG